jgi:hypothetical protein
MQRIKNKVIHLIRVSVLYDTDTRQILCRFKCTYTIHSRGFIQRPKQYDGRSL